MSGLTGVLNAKIRSEALAPTIKKMSAALVHRGPDDEGVFLDAQHGLGLGHRRLGIIDPVNGVQPMLTDDGNLAIIFDGTIFNYLELRRELVAKGHAIKTYSDTEVLLYAYREWGADCVERLVGAFALAIWDKSRARLFCARDRLGAKPFYYVFDGHGLVFASEIKAILASGLVKAKANTAGLQDYLTFQFCLDEKTLFDGVVKLEPGHTMVATLDQGRVKLTTRKYWDLHYNIDTQHDEAWFIDNLASLVDDSVRLNLRSDVPIGAHLSGGLDSSAVVCLASKMLEGEGLKTFTGAFPEGPQFDETEYAKQAAAFAGADYHEVFIQGAELPDVLPKIMHYMDEPLAGPGVIPQYYVSQLAAQHVKVALGGQGGDELFIGYARYLVAYLEQCLSGAIYETAHQQPFAVTLESIVPSLPLLSTYRPMLQNLWREGLFDEPASRYFRLIDRSEGMSQLFHPDAFANNGSYSPFISFKKVFDREGLHSLINQMTYFDLKGSLPALLHVEDRTSMAASLESRVPLLDHRIVEFMATIPPNIKFAGGRMKHIFKESVRNIVPDSVFQRKDKMGFPTPLTQWTQGVAKDFVHDILLSSKATQRGLYNTKAVRQALDNEREFGRVVWGLLCLELWHRIFIDADLDPNGH